MPTEASINERRREMGLPPHRHFWKVVFPRRYTTMYKFVCDCGATTLKYKYGFWLFTDAADQFALRVISD